MIIPVSKEEINTIKNKEKVQALTSSDRYVPNADLEFVADIPGTPDLQLVSKGKVKSVIRGFRKKFMTMQATQSAVDRYLKETKEQDFIEAFNKRNGIRKINKLEIKKELHKAEYIVLW